MELVQFNAEMDRLRARYGKQKYPEVLTDIFWAKFKQVEYTAFRKVVAKLIAHEAYAPLFEKFQQELRVELAAIRENQIEDIAKKQNCPGCQNTGRVSVTINPKHAPYSFRCYCKLGKEMFPNFPEQPKSRETPNPTTEKLDELF